MSNTSSRVTYTKLPWSGGVNASVDPALIPDTDLVQADNVLFGISNSRLKRDGIDYFDQLTAPSVTSCTRSGTTITITFSTNIQTAGNDIYVVGEKLNIQTSDAQFTNTTATITAIPAANQIQYTVGVTPTAGSCSVISITRTASIVGVHDFWYYTAGNDSKSQVILAVNSDTQIFRFDINGNRKQLTNKTDAVTFTIDTDAVGLTAHNKVVGDAVSFTSITGTTGISINNTYYVSTVIDVNNFKISTTKGGSDIDLLTANGSGVMVSPLYTTNINSAVFETINETCLIAFEGIGNYPKVYVPRDSTTVVRGVNGAAPNASIMRKHLGRIWMNDKTIKEQLFYSSSFNADLWNGYQDSGVLNIGFGDGDPEGINAIFPPFKKVLFVTKRNTLYRINGLTPEDFTIDEVTQGLGSVAHRAVAAIDIEDVFFHSHKGIHSLNATSSYGDFSGAFKSDKIQPIFNNWTKTRFKYNTAAYIPSLNSLFFSVASGDYDTDKQDTLWVFNTKNQEWHRWPKIYGKCLGAVDVNGVKNLVIGRYDGRIDMAQTGEYVDHDIEAIEYKIKSGTIYVDGNPNTVKAFKSLGFIFRPKGDYTFSVTAKIDNYNIQPLVFSQVSGGARLGQDFRLGYSILAVGNTLAPHVLPIDGIGRGITVTIEQNATDQEVEIYGLVIEWIPVGTAQETIGSQDL